MKFVELTVMAAKSSWTDTGAGHKKLTYTYTPERVLVNLEHVTHVEVLAAGLRDRPQLTGISLADGSADGPSYLQVAESFDAIKRLICRNGLEVINNDRL